MRKRFPDIHGPKQGDMCYATTNRQKAVKELASSVDCLLVVGSKNSSNSNRLKELGEALGVQSHLIDCPEDIEIEWFNSVKNLGISSGASAPEHLVQEVVQYMKENFEVSEVKPFAVMKENVKFSLPKELDD